MTDLTRHEILARTLETIASNLSYLVEELRNEFDPRVPIERIINDSLPELSCALKKWSEDD